MARPKGSRDIAPKVRFHILKALDSLQEKTQKEPWEHIVDEIEENGLAPTLQKLAGYIPKEQDISVSGEIALNTEITQEELELMRQMRSATEERATTH